MRLAVIPARGGSKRIPDKNIMPFMGRPMIAWALSAARDSGLFDTIHVSTDLPAIAAVAAAEGFAPDFPRPPGLADDATPMMPVTRFVLERYGVAGRAFADACVLFPCAPLIEAEDLRRGFALYESHRRAFDLLTVAAFPVPVEWAYERAADGRLTPRRPGAFAIRSQDLPRSYYETGGFAIFAAERVLAGTAAGDGNFVSLELPRHKAVDIDEPEDLRLAEILFRGRLAAGG